MRKLIVVMWLTVGLAACAAPITRPSPATSVAVRKIRLPMGYIPSVQYANFYVAVEKGYFAAEGLEIEFDYSYETNGVQLVGANQLPLAVGSGEQVLLARAQGLPVVYVMAWFQKFPVAIVSEAEAGITAPGDLRGKRIGVPTLDGASFVGLRALLAQAGIRPDEVTIEAIGFNQVAALSAGQVEAVVVYTNNEPIRLAAQGENLNVIQVSDYAALAANGILSNEATIANEPELIRRFLRALLRGTQEALDHPDEAYATAKKYVETLTDDALERQVLAATLELWEAPRLGYSSPEAWENMQATLLDANLLSQPVELTGAYTNAFVP